MKRFVVRKLLETCALQPLTGQLAWYGDDRVVVGDNQGRLAAVHNIAYIVQAEIGIGALADAVERTQDVGVKFHFATFVAGHTCKELFGVVHQPCFLGNGVGPQLHLLHFGTAHLSRHVVYLYEGNHRQQYRCA